MYHTNHTGSATAMAPENMNSAPAMETVKPCLKRKLVCHPGTSTSGMKSVLMYFQKKMNMLQCVKLHAKDGGGCPVFWWGCGGWLLLMKRFFSQTFKINCACEIFVFINSCTAN